ncbi:ankyrin repeat-containing domain protein [Aspergillus aurantiobrunneus]
MSLLRLPNELLKVTWDLLRSNRERNAVALTCRRFYYTFNIYLYREAVQHDFVRVSRWAARHGREDTMEKLIKEGLDVSGGPSTTPLFEAAIHGQKSMIQFLMRHGLKDLNMRMLPHGGTALHLAVSRDHEDVVRFLLEQGVDLDGRNMYRDAPLHVAARNGREKLVSLLLDGGADPDTEDARTLTPLWHAVDGGHLGVMKIILNRLPKCRVDGAGSGQSPLFRAVEMNFEPAARLLLKAGARIDRWHKPEPTSSWAPLHTLTPVEMQVRLIRQQLDTIRNKYPCTALHWAINRNLMDMVRLILDEGVILERSGSLAVACATERGNEKMAQLLLERGVDPNFPDALCEAARGGFEGIAKKVLDAGAEPTLPALDHAARLGHDGVVFLLVERGINLDQQRREKLLERALHTKNSRLFRALVVQGVDIDQVKDQRLKQLLEAQSHWIGKDGRSPQERSPDICIERNLG